MKTDDYIGTNVQARSSISRTVQDKNVKRIKSVKSNVM